LTKEIIIEMEALMVYNSNISIADVICRRREIFNNFVNISGDLLKKF
jgi:hypothetical protein